jgi:rfaE bifunctional protein nucleotidyltransferase chain/domain
LIININEIEKLTADLKSKGLRIVFTNGVFDILHRGHAQYLLEAKDLGDILIVGVNCDSSVKRLKGEGRPVNNESDRAFLIDSLRSVDYTVIFKEDTPYSLIKKIVPDVLVKGGDYDPGVTDILDKRYIVGSDIVRSCGGHVAVIGLVPGRSTTNTIEKLKGKK